MDRKMDCKEFLKLIPDFLNRDLEYRTLKHFLKHALHCSECFEELNIQFLITEGMNRLEEGDAFDLQSELQGRLEEARLKMRRHKKWIKIGIVLGITAALVIAGLILWFVL